MPCQAWSARDGLVKYTERCVSPLSALLATIRLMLNVTPFLLIAVAASAQDLRHLGDFGNVSSNDGGEHCAGYSLGLWRYGDQLLGLLDLHQGLCGDPPCAVIRDATLDTKTGRLEFWSTINDRKIQFEGTMTTGAIDGALNGERVRLQLARDRMSSGFDPNYSVIAWCKFWGSVARCSGVQEMCLSINTPGGKSAAPSSSVTQTGCERGRHYGVPVERIVGSRISVP